MMDSQKEDLTEFLQVYGALAAELEFVLHFSHFDKPERWFSLNGFAYHLEKIRKLHHPNLRDKFCGFDKSLVDKMMIENCSERIRDLIRWHLGEHFYSALPPELEILFQLNRAIRDASDFMRKARDLGITICRSADTEANALTINGDHSANITTSPEIKNPEKLPEPEPNGKDEQCTKPVGQNTEKGC